MRAGPGRRPGGTLAGVEDDDLRTPGGLSVPANSLVWSFSRSGGPGGQHVNTTSSKATLTIDTATVVGSPAASERLRATLGAELRVTNQTARSQWRNRQLCLERAAVLLDEAARPPDRPRRASRPTRGSVERRLQAKRKDSEKKQGRSGSGW